MKFRTTLILLVLAGALGAYLWFVEQHQQTTKEAKDSSRQVVKVDRDKITAISIKNPEAKVELVKQGDDWHLQEPLKDRADSMAMSQLFTSLEMLKHDAVIEPDSKGGKDQMKEFGLADSDTKIRLSGGEKPVELLFGKDAAVEGKVYVRVEGSNTAYVISNDLKNQISKKPDEFRDKKLTDLTVAKVQRAVIKSGAGEIEVQKKDEHWSLVKPLKARGDDSKIGDLISQAITARIDTFVADGANLSAHGLEPPRGTVSLYTEGSDQPVILNIGANPKEEKDKEKTYAKLSTRDAVVLLPKSVEKILETKPNDLRDKNLVRFESDIVDRITIEPAGKEKLVLARDKEKWVRKADKDVPINSTIATRLLEDLKNATVVNFVADVATELPKYGLDNPQVKVTLSSYASENTAESKAGEKPIVAILFGKLEGNDVYAKLDDEPFIVSVARAVVDSIVTDPLQLQELTIYQHKPEEITAFDVTREGQPTLSLERDKEKNWKLAKGDGAVNQVAAQSLVNTLASLRAVRWVGATKPEEQDLVKPAVTVNFKTAGNTTGKLTLSKLTSEGMANATAEGLTGTFVVSRPDAEAFLASLLETPAAASPATTTGTPASAPGAAAPRIEATTPPVSAPAPVPPQTPTPSEPPPKPAPGPSEAAPKPAPPENPGSTEAPSKPAPPQ